MINFMGLGFNFGGKDLGLTKVIDSTLGSVNGLVRGIAGVSEAMGGLAKQGRDPTTSFESEMIKNNVGLTKMGANLGKTGKQIEVFTRKSQGLALTMNRSVEATGEAVGQFDRMREASVATGISSEKVMLKIADASGVNAQTFADASLQMMKMHGMSKEAGAAILDSMTAAGKATGDVAGALGETSNRMALLQQRSALLAQGFKGIGIEEFSKQIDQTAVDMQRITKVSASTARAFATGLAGSIQDSAQAFKELSVGVGTDIPEGLKGLALTTGDIGTAFSTMEDGPEGFMKTMRNMTKGMGGDKEKIGQLMTWIQARTGQAFGPERSKEIVNMLAASTEETDKQSVSIKDATGALKKYGDEAYKNGRTAAASMQLSEDMFIARIRNINKTANTFAAEAGKSFNLLGGEIETLAKDKGPVGQLTGTLIDLDQKGLIGLLPAKLQGTAVAMGGFVERLGKTLTGIINPLNLVEGGVVLFATAMTDAFMKQTKNEKTLSFMDRLGLAFQEVGDSAVAYLETLPDKITGVLSTVADTLSGFFGDVGGSGVLSGQIKHWWKRILDVFTKMGPILDRLKKFAKDFWAGFTSTMSLDPSKSSLGEKAGQWLGSIWDGAVEWFDRNVWGPIKKFGKDFWEGLTTALDPEKSKIAKADASTGGVLGKWLGGVILSAKKYWNEEIVPMAEAFWNDLTKAFSGTGDPSTTGGKIGIWLGKAFKVAIAAAEVLLDTLLNALIDKIATMMMRATVRLLPGGGNALDVYDAIKTARKGETFSPAGASSPSRGALEGSNNAVVALEKLVSIVGDQKELLKKQNEAQLESNQLMEDQNKLLQSGGGNFSPGVSGPTSSSGSGLSNVSSYTANRPTTGKPTTRR